MSDAPLPPQSDAGAEFTQLILLVFRLNGRLQDAAGQMAAAGGLTAARWQVLGGTLDEPRSVSDIARLMGLSRQSVQRVANALVADAFATWESNPRHRRAKLLAPTQNARAAIHEIATLAHPWSSAVGDAIGAAQLRRATRAVQEVLAAMHDCPPQPPAAARP
jgi:DNA-binding MarR family transcriptional regulator